MSMTTFRVLFSNVPSVTKALEKLAKRGTKKGLPVPAWSWGATTVADEVYYGPGDQKHEFKNVARVELVLDSKPLCYAGWSFVAALSHVSGEGNLVRTLPDQELPVMYRTAAANCDHCKMARRRHETFVVRHEDGAIKQVGSTCIEDFLGGHGVENLAAQAEMLADFRRIGEDGEDDFTRVDGKRTHFEIEAFLAATATDVRVLGWMSRTAARETEGASTADSVWRRLSNKPEASNPVFEAVDGETATAALAWALELSDELLATEKSDYLHNVRVIARAGHVDRKMAGIAASIITAYQRAVAKARKDAEKAALPTADIHLGTIGKRQSFGTVILDFVTGYETEYGYTTILKFRTEEGATLVWKASSTSITRLDAGKRFLLTGTVKAHDLYKGAKQTSVSRCKAVEA
jgi:hypothetical protein